MDQSLSDAVEYLKGALPAAFGGDADDRPTDRPTVQLDPGSAFWDQENRSPDVRIVPDESRGELLDDIGARSSRVRGHVLNEGVEALAWYVPFHLHDDWGIYLTIDGIAYVAREVLDSHGASTGPLDLAIEVGATALLRHEEFHYEVEVFATGQELLLGKPVYRRYLDHFRGTGRFRREESLGNRRMVRHRWKSLGGQPTVEAVKGVADAGPRDYSHWERYVPNQAYTEAKDALMAEVVEGKSHPLSGDPPGAPVPLTSIPRRYGFFPGRQHSTPIWRRCSIPLYVVTDSVVTPWDGLFFANLAWRQLLKWGKSAVPGWYFPAVPGPHKGEDSKIWTGGSPGEGYGIPVKVYGGTNAVSKATLDGIARHAGIPVGMVGRAQPVREPALAGGSAYR